MRVTLEPDKMVWERREKSQQRERSSFYLAAPHDGIWQLVTSRAPCLGGKKSCDLCYKNLCVCELEQSQKSLIKISITLSHTFEKMGFRWCTLGWAEKEKICHISLENTWIKWTGGIIYDIMLSSRRRFYPGKLLPWYSSISYYA